MPVSATPVSSRRPAIVVIWNVDPSADRPWLRLNVPRIPKEWAEATRKIQQNDSVDLDQSWKEEILSQRNVIQAANYLGVIGQLLLMTLNAYHAYDYDMQQPESNTIHLTMDQLVERMVITCKNLQHMPLTLNYVAFSSKTNALVNRRYPAKQLIPIVLSVDMVGVDIVDPTVRQVVFPKIKAGLQHLMNPSAARRTAFTSSEQGFNLALVATDVEQALGIVSVNWNSYLHPLTNATQNEPVRFHFAIPGVPSFRRRLPGVRRSVKQRNGRTTPGFPLSFFITNMRPQGVSNKPSKKRLASVMSPLVALRKSTSVKCPHQANPSKKQRTTPPRSPVPLFLFVALPIPSAISGRDQVPPCEKTLRRLALKRPYSVQSARPIDAHQISLRRACPERVDKVADGSKRARHTYCEPHRRARV